MSKWISVKDRLPEPLADVLVYHAGGSIDLDWMDHAGEFMYESIYGCATHWMPLPEPPKDVP